MGWAHKKGLEGKPLYEERDTAASIGTVVHAMVENMLAGPYEAERATGWGDLDLDGQLKANQAMNAFLRWRDNFKLTVIAQEVQMVSEKHAFGGTPDLIAMVGNQVCLVDWKTSKSVYESYLVQLAAYKGLWNENHPDQPIDGPIHLLRFDKEYGDFTHKSWEDLDEGWEQFLLFRRAYDINAKLKRRAA